MVRSDETVRPGDKSQSRRSLRSILALAGGAAGIPLAAAPADAAIVVDETTLYGQTVGFLPGQLASLSVTLPGGQELSFGRQQGGTIGYSSTRRVFAKMPGAGGGFGFGQQSNGRSVGAPGFQVAFRTGAKTSVNWSSNAKLRTGTLQTANIILSDFQSKGGSYLRGPGPFSDKFLLFKFDNAGTPNFGWVEMLSAARAETPGVDRLSVTFGRLAYDTSGATLGVAVVPEPASAALAMGGALVAGAAGLRRWRKRCQPPNLGNLGILDG